MVLKVANIKATEQTSLKTHRGERIRIGKSKREIVARVAHARVQTKDRKFDPIAVLLASAEERVPELLPIKYARMKVSPFAFFRGAVSIMAADLALLPHTDLNVQLCGDAHVQNLGSFSTEDGRLVFDLNDFDETIQGPWEWDVKRMATSIVLAGQESGHSRGDSRRAAEEFAASYCQFIGEFSRQPILQVARHQIRRQRRIQPVHAALRQSERAKPLDLLNKFTEQDAWERIRFRDLKPDFWRISGRTAKDVLGSFAKYRKSLSPERQHLFNLFRSVDVGFKVVGTGSVGLRDYVVLLEGNGLQDPVFLQIKQEVASAYAKFLPRAADHQGQRVAHGQRAIQPLSDPLLGWTEIGRHQYLVRQLNDHKGRVDLERLHGKGLSSLAVIAGELLGRGHARTGDACHITGYCGSGAKIIKAIADFACQYADQTEADYGAFLTAIRRGKIKTAKAAG